MNESMKREVVDEESEVQLPGFRFHPTDEELVGFYLKRKVEKRPLRMELIKQVDIYKYDPWDLPKNDVVKEKEWYFFCIRGRKYRNSVRPNRVTRSGFWKATGIDKPIYSAKQPHDCIGLKKSLVYYRGSAGKGTKTDWMMHEFRLPPCGNDTDHVLNAKSIAQEAEVWTLCRVFKRVQTHKKYLTEIKGSNIINQNRQVNSSLRANSFGSDCIEQCMSFCESPAQQILEMKPIINQADERNYFLLGDLNSITQTPFPISYSNLWNLNEEDPLACGNWDELRPVVDRAITPSQVFDCT